MAWSAITRSFGYASNNYHEVAMKERILGLVLAMAVTSFAAHAAPVELKINVGVRTGQSVLYNAAVKWHGSEPGSSATYWIVVRDAGGTVWPQMSGKLGAWATSSSATLSIANNSVYPLSVYVLGFDGNAERRLENGFASRTFYVVNFAGTTRLSNECTLAEATIRRC